MEYIKALSVMAAMAITYRLWGLAQEGLLRLIATTPRYRLYKVMRKKTGLVVGINQYGSIWLEARRSGKLVKMVYTVQKNPTPRRVLLFSLSGPWS